MVLTLTNGMDSMYRVQLDQKFMEEHKKKTGIEGTWPSYFELFKSALDLKNIGLEKSEEGNIIFKVHYPLLEGARICGQFVLKPR